MKKKKTGIIIGIVLAVVLIAGGTVAYALLPHPLNYKIKDIASVGSSVQIVSREEDEVVIRKDGEDFKVLAFTDMHLDGKNGTSYLTVDNFVRNITDEKPDLVILGGDTVTSAFNKKRTNQFGEILEKLGVYWAGGLGNHEGDNKFSLTRDKMFEIFMSYDHCLFRKGQDGLFGVGNYALVILNGDDTVKQVYYFLDTGDEMSAELKTEYGVPAEDDPYDGVKKDQVAWYTAKNEELKEKYGDFRSTVVVHIPIYQMDAAAEEETFLYGEKLENVCAAGFDSGFFDAMKKGGTTQAVFFGHDHLNTFGVEKDGILLSYLQPSGYGSYTAASRLGYEEKDWLQGYTVFGLGEDGSFTSEFVRNSAK